jgi:hypothetical protein
LFIVCSILCFGMKFGLHIIRVNHHIVCDIAYDVYIVSPW